MKRFTETTKWRDPWYRKLSPISKLLWGYVTDLCDAVGIIDLDLEAASFDIGSEVTEANIAELGDRITNLGGGKLLINKFIEFQYGKLSELCPAHKPVFRLLEKHKMEKPVMESKNTLALPYDYPSATLLEVVPVSASKKSDPVDEQALEVYNAYPKKVGKPVAIKAIKRAIKENSFEFILEKTRAYALARKGEDPQFTPYPSTWFGQQRFSNDPSTWKNGAAAKQFQKALPDGQDPTDPNDVRNYL